MARPCDIWTSTEVYSTADRSLVIKSAVQREYPVTRAARTTYTGTGYGAGYAKGQRADLGTRRVSDPATQALGSGG